MNENQEILDGQLDISSKRRRALLPVWIKIFTWIFMITALIIPIGVIFGLIGMPFNLGLYGLETMAPISLTGAIILALFALKGVVAYGLWTERKWAVNLAIVDGILGLVICTLMMVVMPFLLDKGGFRFSFRLELFALIPYVIKMFRVRPEWIQG
ncbi:MAG: hypothetical protein H6566_28165 [Lewinellaceae bacterium]|nr:hypothetical protein [Lewinellaceae bacterium]